MTSESILNTEGGHIDRQRIAVNSGRVPLEYFCPLCGYLLWKPRSCASCQHLFCHQCIKTWLNTDPTSCPFRCNPYEEKRAPPHIQSMLAPLLISCRNAPSGCTQVLSYDSLEQHENVECKFLTKRCHVCEQLILADRIEQHRTECTPTIVRCSLCHCASQPNFFPIHYNACREQKMKQLQKEAFALPNDGNGTVAVPQSSPAVNPFLARLALDLDEGARPPTVNLPGIQQVFQARQHGFIAHSRAIFILIWLNLSIAPYILCILLFFGACTLVSIPLSIYLFWQREINASIYQASAFIMVFSGLLGFSLPVLLRLMSDTLIITILSVVFVLLGTLNMFLKLDTLQMSVTHTQTGLIYLGIFVIFKIVLFFMRFYFSHVPPYVTAACMAWITVFLVFQNRRGVAHT